jgi:hypothetical protein
LEGEKRQAQEEVKTFKTDEDGRKKTMKMNNGMERIQWNEKNLILILLSFI